MHVNLRSHMLFKTFTSRPVKREGPQPWRGIGGDKVDRGLLLRQQRDGKGERKKEINSLHLFLGTDLLKPENKENWSGKGHGEDKNRGRGMSAKVVRQAPTSTLFDILN